MPADSPSLQTQTSTPAPPQRTGKQIRTPHAMFCRLGGISTGPFASLNLSFGVGDDPALVRRNRQSALRSLGLSRLVSLGQVHGNEILTLVTENKGIELEEFPGYDAVISNLPGVALLIQQADCQAVLLHDPVKKAIAAIHCGWRGSVVGIIAKTIANMAGSYGSDPVHLHAVISPSLGPCCAEFVNFKQELPAWMHAFEPADKKAHFDFWAISRKQLADAGVQSAQIETMGICTRCNRDYFSFRRAKLETGGICGRNGSLIGLAARN